MAALDRKASIDGVSVTIALSGAIILWSGLKNASIADTLRAALKGKIPASGPSGIDIGRAAVGAAQAGAGAAVPGSGPGGRAAAAALSHLGVPYKWGGATPAGWDCSGMVTWVLHHDLGLDLPSNSHTTAFVFHTWPGAVDVATAQPGDLVTWPTHVGIAISPTTMVNAPKPGTVTRVDKIYAGAVIRRPKAYGG